MEQMIKVARHRSTPYVFNYNTNGGTKRYEWSGCMGNKIDSKTLPIEAVDWLLMNSTCFRMGELVIVEDTEHAKEIVENLGSDINDYKNNIRTKEEIVQLLQGNFMKMQKSLNLITIDAEKKFVIEIAKELSNELVGAKLKFMAEWTGVPQDILFD